MELRVVVYPILGGQGEEWFEMKCIPCDVFNYSYSSNTDKLYPKWKTILWNISVFALIYQNTSTNVLAFSASKLLQSLSQIYPNELRAFLMPSLLDWSAEVNSKYNTLFSVVLSSMTLFPQLTIILMQQIMLNLFHKYRLLVWILDLQF